jgi:hypothetical protein
MRVRFLPESRANIYSCAVSASEAWPSGGPLLLLLLRGRLRHQVRNHGDGKLDIDFHRPCFFQRRHLIPVWTRFHVLTGC